jgi:phosphate-selective porin OprO/OprP
LNLSQLRNVAILACICALLNTSTQESSAPKFRKELFTLIKENSTESMKIDLRFQTLATSNWDANNGFLNPESLLFIRRSRLKFDPFSFSPKLIYKV